jgi:hypothetical protein
METSDTQSSEQNVMERPTTISAVALLIALAGGFALFMFSEISLNEESPTIAGQQELVELKQRIALLETRVNWLAERFTEPQRQKPSQF